MEPLDRKTHFDFTLFFTALLLWGIGIALVYSATHIHARGPLAGIAKTQVVWVVMGVFIMLIIVSVPSRIYFTLSYAVYGLSLLLLVFILLKGVESKGAGRWIALGSVRFQPSEFAKIGLLLALARYFSTRHISLLDLRSLVMPVLLIAVPFCLVMKQPDLGTAMVFCTMSLPVFLWAGMPLIELFYLTSPVFSLALSAVPLFIAFGSHGSAGILSAVPWGGFFLLVCAVLYFFRPPPWLIVAIVAANLVTAGVTTVAWNAFLKDYQKMRIVSFVNPQADPYGAGYQVIQSKVAIGSGGLLGKGYLKGTQTRLSFLPEQHTDFIFSVLGEQFGLAGSAAVILLLLLLLVRGYLATWDVRNRFTCIVVVGAVSIMAFHIFLNIAMTLGMMPVTGVPLPFLSYGGSFTLTVATLTGFILNSRMGRQDF
jgi:rod shape determining protein RodA